MKDYRPGDHFVQLSGRNYHLRLSLSALAEISYRLGADGPKDLAAILRKAEPSIWQDVFKCLAHPRLQENLSSKDMLQAVPVMVRVITEALS